ncbi:MAG: hypothetical protein HAW58_04220, partial [Candidatus Thioglobus sp.]|nr:hypothetical protein [Candidatus Thioglobus sp.]
IIILVLMSLWNKRPDANSSLHISTIKTSLLALFALGSVMALLLRFFWNY